MVGWVLGMLSANAADEAGTVQATHNIEMTKLRPSMRREVHDNFMVPYIFDEEASPKRLIALDDGRVLRHADFARLFGDEERAKEIEYLAARDKRLLYGGLALTGASLLLSLTAPYTSAPLSQSVTALGLDIGGLCLLLPAAIPGKRVKATRYTRGEVERLLTELPSDAISEDDTGR